jgi:hypothetical protein
MPVATFIGVRLMPAAAFAAPLFGADRGMTTAVGKESIDQF